MVSISGIMLPSLRNVYWIQCTRQARWGPDVMRDPPPIRGHTFATNLLYVLNVPMYRCIYALLFSCTCYSGLVYTSALLIPLRLALCSLIS